MVPGTERIDEEWLKNLMPDAPEELLGPATTLLNALTMHVEDYEEQFYMDEDGTIYLSLSYVNTLRNLLMRMFADSDDPIEHGWNHKPTLEFALQHVRAHKNELADKKERIIHKAGFLLHRIASGHPFTDGNKRTATACANAFLEYNGHTLGTLPYEKAEAFMLEVAKGNKTEPDCTQFIREHLRELAIRPEFAQILKKLSERWREER